MAATVQKTADGKKVVAATAQPKRMDEVLTTTGKWEVDASCTFRVRFGLVQKETRWVVIPPDKTADKNVEQHWVEFRMWTYLEEVGLKKAATIYDQEKRMHMLDQNLLNRMKVQKLLRSWSFEVGNPRLKLLHVNGILSDEGWNAFVLLAPTIVRYVLDEMNNVLEFNS